jgi:hypothetical protein
MSRERPLRRGQGGFVTLAALFMVLIITVIGGVLLSSLFGELQGESGYNRAVSASAAAEAGLHWAGNKLGGSSAATQVYAGDTSQGLQAAGGQPVAVFDAVVSCADGSAVNAGSAGCATQPNERLIQATGYVPSKASPLGVRTVQALVAQNTFYNKTLCAYQNITLSQGVTVQGDVGSEGTTNPDLSLQGPSGNAARIEPAPGGAQPGSAYAVSATSCSQGCGAQVAGTVNNNQTPGTVCPNLVQVASTYTCAPGTASLSGGAVTISAANNSLNTVTLGSGGSVTFVTAGPSDVLTVNVASISAGSNTQFVLQGGGIVQLNVAGTLTVGQGSGFGLNTLLSPLPNPIPTGDLVPAGHLIVRSCSTANPAIWFNQAGGLSAVFITPQGGVKLDQAQNSQGAILAATITLDQSTAFGFDPSASAVGLGFNKLLSWQDVP